MRHWRARGRPPSDCELHGTAQGERGPARTLMHFCERIQLRRVRVDNICKIFMHYYLRSRHVFFLPGVAVQLLS